VHFKEFECVMACNLLKTSGVNLFFCWVESIAKGFDLAIDIFLVTFYIGIFYFLGKDAILTVVVST
jgi:hypothetical protein